MHLSIALHNGTVDTSPPIRAGFDHIHTGATSERVVDSFHREVATRTYAISPVCTPLPPFDQSYALRYDSITYFIGATHESMMKGDVGSFPACRFPCLDSVFVSVLKVGQAINLALDEARFQDHWNAKCISDDEFGFRAIHSSHSLALIVIIGGVMSPATLSARKLPCSSLLQSAAGSLISGCALTL